MTNAELKIIMKLKDEATKKINTFRGHIQHAANAIKKNWVPITASIVATIYAAKKLADAYIGVSKALIKASDVTEQYQVRLTTLLGSAREGNKVFEEMTELATQVPKTYEEIMAAATDLSAVVRGGSEEIKKLMPIIVDISAGTGMAVREVTGQIIRMYSAGAAAADMFRERGVSAALGFQAGVSYTAEETMKTLTEQWEKGIGKYVGASAALAETFTGMTSMMEDAWFQFKVGVGEELFEQVKLDLRVILGLIKESKEEGGKYNEVVKGLSDIFVNTLADAKNFFAGLIVGGAQAKDAMNEVKSAVANIQMSIAALGLGEAQSDLDNLWGRLFDTEEARAKKEQALMMANEFYEVAKQMAFDARDAADEDESQRMEERLEKLQAYWEERRLIEEVNAAFEGLGGKPLIPDSGILERMAEQNEQLIELRRETEAEIANDIIEKQQEVVDGLRDVWGAWNNEKLSMEMARIQRETEFYNFAIKTQQKANESLWGTAGKMRDKFSTGMSKMFADSIKGTVDWKKAMTDLGMQMVESLMEYGVQIVINSVLAKALQAAQVAVSTAAAAATASAWAPAAAMASLATMGANAVPASAALSSVAALAHALAIPKFAEGGEGVVTRPTLFLAGEAGPEAYQFTPMRKVGGGPSGGGNIYIDINVNLAGSFIGSGEIAEEIAPAIMERLDDLNFAEYRRI